MQEGGRGEESEKEKVVLEVMIISSPNREHLSNVYDQPIDVLYLSHPMSGKLTLLFHKLDLSSRPWVQLSVFIFRQTCSQQTEVSVFASRPPFAFHGHRTCETTYFLSQITRDLCVMCFARAMIEVMTPAMHTENFKL